MQTFFFSVGDIFQQLFLLVDYNKKVWKAFGSLDKFMFNRKKGRVVEAAWKEGPEMTKTSTGQDWILLPSQNVVKRYTGR